MQLTQSAAALTNKAHVLRCIDSTLLMQHTGTLTHSCHCKIARFLLQRLLNDQQPNLRNQLSTHSKSIFLTPNFRDAQIKSLPDRTQHELYRISCASKQSAKSRRVTSPRIPTLQLLRGLLKYPRLSSGSIHVEFLKDKRIRPSATDTSKIESRAEGHQMIGVMIFAVHNQILQSLLAILSPLPIQTTLSQHILLMQAPLLLQKCGKRLQSRCRKPMNASPFVKTFICISKELGFGRKYLSQVPQVLMQ